MALWPKLKHLLPYRKGKASTASHLWLRRLPSFNVTKEKYTQIKRFAVLAWKCVVVISINHFVITHIFNFAMTSGPSMLPLLNEEGELLLLDVLTPKLFGYKAGDVVVAVNPLQPFSRICKRIRATSGDILKLQNTHGFITAVEEVPVGHVWLEGDNKQCSLDSRHYGSVSKGLLRGRAVCKLWPLWKFKFIKNEPV